MTDREPAVLVLEDGTAFWGESVGALGATTGEAVFTTGMTGYQETLTDPSYHRQIVVQTSVHIGNTGLNEDDDESEKVWVAGYVMRETPRASSSWRATRELESSLIESAWLRLVKSTPGQSRRNYETPVPCELASSQGPNQPRASMRY